MFCFSPFTDAGAALGYDVSDLRWCKKPEPDSLWLLEDRHLDVDDADKTPHRLVLPRDVLDGVPPLVGHHIRDLVALGRAGGDFGEQAVLPAQPRDTLQNLADNIEDVFARHRVNLLPNARILADKVLLNPLPNVASLSLEFLQPSEHVVSDEAAIEHALAPDEQLQAELDRLHVVALLDQLIDVALVHALAEDAECLFGAWEQAV